MQGFLQLAQAQATVKLPFGPRGGVEGGTGVVAQALDALFERRCGVGTVGQLARCHTHHPVGHAIHRAFGQVHHTLRHAHPGQAAVGAWSLVYSHQNGFALFRQQFVVGQCAGRDHTHHLALHRAFASNFAHLLANGHRFPVADQFGQVAFHGVKGHARHGDGRTSGLPTLGEGDVQQGRSSLGIRIEHLVEVAHAVEEQGVGMLSFEGQVLLHHRRVRSQEGIDRGGHWPDFAQISQAPSVAPGPISLRRVLLACDVPWGSLSP